MQGRGKIHFKIGDTVGHLQIKQRVRDKIKGSANTRIQFRCECLNCGNKLTVAQHYLLRDKPKTHCGCLTATLYSSNKLEYRVWVMMHVRCEDPRHEAYKHYGGRGISVCEEWHRSRGELGFKAFLEHIGARKSTLYSIDRIDNDKGYFPGNVRWATAKQQRANQRPRSKKSESEPQSMPN